MIKIKHKLTFTALIMAGCFAVLASSAPQAQAYGAHLKVTKIAAKHSGSHASTLTIQVESNIKGTFIPGGIWVGGISEASMTLTGAKKTNLGQLRAVNGHACNGSTTAYTCHTYSRYFKNITHGKIIAGKLKFCMPMHWGPIDAGHHCATKAFRVRL